VKNDEDFIAWCQADQAAVVFPDATIKRLLEIIERRDAMMKILLVAHSSARNAADRYRELIEESLIYIGDNLYRDVLVNAISGGQTEQEIE
jgi:hypothetical protein